MKKIGILGGTFDPIHNGHIETAVYFYNYLDLDKVIFIPTNDPPHKLKLSSTTASDRINMCKLAISKYANFEISTIEILRGGKSYTYETLKELKKLNGESKLHFILGADMFVTIDKWKNPEEIFECATLCVVPRDNIDKTSLDRYAVEIEKLGAKSIIMNYKPTNVSSTQIRQNVIENKSISGLVPHEVENYIYSNKLYSR